MDDTAAAVLALISQDSKAANSREVAKAAILICGMHNKDGGWSAFELNTDSLWLNKIPSSGMDALCDPSSADVTGRIFEAFSLMLQISLKTYVDPQILNRISIAYTHGLDYLASTQEQLGRGMDDGVPTTNTAQAMFYVVSNNSSRGVYWFRK